MQQARNMSAVSQPPYNAFIILIPALWLLMMICICGGCIMHSCSAHNTSAPSQPDETTQQCLPGKYSGIARRWLLYTDSLARTSSAFQCKGYEKLSPQPLAVHEQLAAGGHQHMMQLPHEQIAGQVGCWSHLFLVLVNVWLCHFKNHLANCCVVLGP